MPDDGRTMNMSELIRGLTPEEAKLPYAKYYYRPIAPPNPKLIEILKQGPMDPAKALKPENINDLLNPGYHEVETGYCIMPDGTGYAAINNVFPGSTVEMHNWWFAWHALEDIRYMLWFNKGHFGIRISDADRAKILDPDVPMVKKYQGMQHHVVEDVGGGVEDIEINFLTPEEMGFDMERFKAPAVATIVGANGFSQARAGGPKAPAIMLHFAREIPGGIEFRTRFWMGWHMINGKPVKLLPDGIRIPIQAPMGLAFHNVEEYSNLAAFLPEIYKEMQGKVS